MKNWNWKQILKYIAAIIGIVTGGAVGGGVVEYASAPALPPGQELPTDDPELEPGPGVWTVSAWFVTERTMSQPGMPSRAYTDNVGYYTLEIQGAKRPTDEQIIRAHPGGLNPETTVLRDLRIVPPKPDKD